MPADSFTFSLDQNLAQGAIQLDAGSHPELLRSLLDPDAELPAGDVVIAGGDLSVAPGKDITVGPAKIGFSADLNAAVGVFSTPGALREAVLKKADLVSQIAERLSFSGPAGARFLMLRWGYDISGTVAGSVALAPSATLSFSANAKRKGYYAMVQTVDAHAKARASIESLVTSWKVPSQVDDITKLPAGTWLISEVDGSFGIGAKVSFGYAFNWLRTVDGLGLKGDVGLKLQAGLSASIGFGLSGKYAVVVNRDSSAPLMRMRLYKLRVSDWNFGFDGKLTATPVTPLPENFDDLLKAVTGTHGQQIMKLLGQVEDWADPSKPLFGPFVNLASDEALKVIREITGVTDLAAAFDQVKGRIQSLFQFWDGLPQKATQLIWSKLPDSGAISAVAGIAKKVATFNDTDLTQFLQTTLADVPFLNSPAGQALESFAASGLFDALQGNQARAEIQKAAGLVGQILDGSELQSLLTKLQDAVNTKLDLKKLESVVDQASFDSLDAWLKARLEDFLEQKLAGSQGMAELKKLRDGLHAILAKKDELYAKALEALKRNYDFTLHATYQSTTTTSALLDVTFDFGVAGSQAGDGLRLALAGKFDQLLAGSLTGVKVNDGVLAFGLHKESHISLSLPHFATNSVHVNDAVAKLKTVDEDAGGLIFSLEATDLYTVKNDYSSALGITLTMPGKQAPAVRIHSVEDAGFRYNLKVAVPALTAAGLAAQYAPYARTYFTSEFKPDSPGRYEDWVQQIAPADGKFGNTLLSLKVSLPASATLAWRSAPDSDQDAAYKKMSIALQGQFKRTLHDTFFNDVRNYRNVAGDTAARAVLVFCSIPACSDAKPVNGGDDVAFQDENAPGKTVYWNYLDRDLRPKVLGNNDTVANLRTLLNVARERIQAAGDPDNVLGNYADGQALAILKAALQGRFLDFLFPVESHMVEEARNAGLKMAAFRKNQFANPEQARKDLAKFGQTLSGDFNSNLKTFAVGDALLPLGTAVYAAAAASLDASAATVAAAMLTIRVLKDGVAFPPKGLEPANDADVLRTERIVRA